MSTRQTLNMLVRAARSSISDDERDNEVARTAERLTSSGPFKAPMFVIADVKVRVAWAASRTSTWVKAIAS
jgi:hypothetical protein